jgi:hypothetical protein
VPPGPFEHLDLRLTAVAERQHGVVARRQLLHLGATSDAIRHRLAVGRLRRLHRGVYATGLLGPYSRYMAAVLACGERAFLSHRSAAALWGLRPAPSGQIEVTVKRRGGPGPAGVGLHTTRSLDRADVTTHRGFPAPRRPGPWPTWQPW